MRWSTYWYKINGHKTLEFTDEHFVTKYFGCGVHKGMIELLILDISVLQNRGFGVVWIAE